MAASDQTWYAAHAAKAKTCVVLEKGPVGALHTPPGDSHKTTRACATD
jgi:hypothetical protein